MTARGSNSLLRIVPAPSVSTRNYLSNAAQQQKRCKLTQLISSSALLAAGVTVWVLQHKAHYAKVDLMDLLLRYAGRCDCHESEG